MVRRGETVNLAGRWLKGHDLSVGYETLGLSLRVRRAAPNIQRQTDEPVEASHGPTKTAILTILRAPPEARERVLARDARGQVLGRVHAVGRRPQPEGAPDHHELEPDELEVPVRVAAQRDGAIEQRPVAARPAERKRKP